MRDIHAILRTFLCLAKFRWEEPGKPQLVSEERMRLVPYFRVKHISALGVIRSVIILFYFIILFNQILRSSSCFTM